MSRKGKSFELLIKKLEEVCLSVGAVIKSPDYIKDTVTGAMREVDISIKQSYKNETHTTVIECRDRTSIADIMWIEQLVTKIKDTNVDKVVAVSSSGFSKNAVIKASHYGIELKTYKQVTQEEIPWFLPDHFVISEEKLTILSAAVYLGNIEHLPSSPFENKGLDEIFLTRTKDNKKISLSEILHGSIPVKNVFSQLPAESSSRIITINIRCENEEKYHFESDNRIYEVREIVMDVEFSIVIKKIYISRKETYGKSLDSVVQLIEFDGVFPDSNSTLQLIKAEDGSMHISSGHPQKS